MIKVAINGFGRIGRLAFRKISESKNVEIVAINDLSTPEMLAYLLKYDSVHGTFEADITSTDNAVVINGKTIPIYAERSPQSLPWGKLNVDVVLECTGIFASKEKAFAHLQAGAKKVIISAPAGSEVKTIVYNVNHDIIT